MEIEQWTLTINIIDNEFNGPLESMSLEMGSLKDCISTIELFKSNGILYSKDVYYQFVLE